MHVIDQFSGEFGGPPELIRRFLVQGSRLRDIPPRTPEPVPTGRRIRVLAVVHGWFPELAAGSERMVQHMLDALPRDEFEYRVWHFGVGESQPTNVRDYEYDGVPVTRSMNPPPGYVPDVIVTHHGIAARVVPSLYEAWPGVHVVSVYHNDRFDIEDIDRVGADLRVYNTQWVKRSLGGRGIVVHPPVEPERHRVESLGIRVTLVNLQDNKGVHVFSDLAARMPLVDFLGVEGTHGTQELDLLRGRPNIGLSPVTQDMRPVWASTRIVLMPSEYESYGMVAAEAAINGIPVIAHPTPGLVECLGGAGIFIDRNDIAGYERAINLLTTDLAHYRVRSGMAAVRGRELVAQTARELNRFVARLRKLVRP